MRSPRATLAFCRSPSKRYPHRSIATESERTRVIWFTLATLAALILYTRSVEAAEPTDCNDFRTTRDLIRDHPEFDCNGNGLADSCDAFGARFSNLRLGTSSPTDRFESVVVLDVDTDGALDVVAGHSLRSELAVFRNQGARTFSAPTPVTLPANARRLVTVHADNDGHPEILALTSEDLLYLTRESSQLSLRDRIIIGSPNNRVLELVTADLDGDGFPEAVVETQNRQMFVVDNQSGRFAPSPTRLPNDHLSSGFALGDVDGDGDLDIAYAKIGGRLAFLANDGTGVFAATPVETTLRTNAFTLADIDRDGRLDIFAVEEKKVLLLRGDGGGAFSRTQTVDTFLNSHHLAFADIDMDGERDLVVVGGILAFHLVRDGVIQPGIKDSASIWVDGTAIGDLDLDGRNDVVLAENGESTLLLRWNLRSPTFDDDRDGLPDECGTGTYFPLRAGNGGSVLVKAHNVDIEPFAEVYLERPGSAVITAEPLRMNPEQRTFNANFNLSSADAGDWGLFMRLPGKTPIRMGPFVVAQSEGWCLSTRIVADRSSRGYPDNGPGILRE